MSCFINNVFNSCRIKAEESGVTLSLKVSADPLKIEVDSHNMERALMNLVSNSIEASSAGQNVIISAEKGKKDFVIRVIDEGVGMDNVSIHRHNRWICKPPPHGGFKPHPH